MHVPDIPDRVVLLLVGVSVIFLPVILLGLTLGFLVFVGDLVPGRLSLLELFELYILELLVLGGFAYGLYRSVRVLVVHKLPASLDSLEEDDSTESVERGRPDE